MDIGSKYESVPWLVRYYYIGICIMQQYNLIIQEKTNMAKEYYTTSCFTVNTFNLKSFEKFV